MNLTNILRALTDDARHPGHAPEFQNRRTRCPVLASYADAVEVLRVLAGRHAEQLTARGLLTRALLDARQATRHPLWSSLLTAAYAPMLQRLRARVRRAEGAACDLDQLVVTSFLEATAFVSPRSWPERSPLYLRQETARRVFKALGRETHMRMLERAWVDLVVVVRPSPFLRMRRIEESLDDATATSTSARRTPRRCRINLCGSFGRRAVRSRVDALNRDGRSWDLPPRRRPLDETTDTREIPIRRGRAA